MPFSDAASGAALQGLPDCSRIQRAHHISGLSDRNLRRGALIQLQALEARAIKLEKDLHKTLSARGGIQVKGFSTNTYEGHEKRVRTDRS